MKQILTFYGNSNSFFFFSFFLISAKKRELDFINFHFVFSISIYSPHFQPDSPYSHSVFLHSHPDPRIPTLTPHIPTLTPRIHTLIPPIPTLIPSIPINPILIPRISTLIPHIPIIPFIPFPDSPFWLLQIALKNFK